MGTSDDMLQMQVSIIVPVFNEAPFIRPFLEHLRERAAEAEIIVVDGASTDGTDELAAGLCDQLIRSGQRSRAIQMNAGACAAKGDIFWFLHADAESWKMWNFFAALAAAAVWCIATSESRRAHAVMKQLDRCA